MSCRILNCSTSLTNYYLCINEKVVGFSSKIAQSDDTIYICVKIDKDIICGARAILSELTDYKPWDDSDKYKQCYSLKNIEFCNPFNINILSQIEHIKWYILFVQASKPIKNQTAIDLLNSTFNQNKIDKLFIFPNSKEDNSELELNDNFQQTNIKSNNKLNNEHISIMGTF